MHVTGDLGFSSLVLVIIFVITFIIRRKWRLSVERNEEIKRLLILASEETARAELEATVSSCGAVSVSSKSGSYQCAVCYCPTTTRCSRCKAVRYCSGRCQIIHWRQGHKEECRSATFDSNDDGGIASLEAKQEQSNIFNERYSAASVETCSEEPQLSNSTSVSGVPCENEDDGKVNSVADASSISDSSSSSFSGFSSSPPNGDSSDDLSVGESISLNEFERSDGQTPSITSSFVHEPLPKKVDESKSVSPKFASLVKSVDSLKTLNEFKQSKSHSNDGKSKDVSSSTKDQSCSTMHEASSIQHGKVSSGFWDRSLDCVSPSKVIQCHQRLSSSSGCDRGLSSSSGSGNRLSSDSQSFLHFKFDLSGSNASSFNGQSAEVKGTVPDETPPAALGSRPVNAAALLENHGEDDPVVRSSAFSGHAKSSHASNESTHESNVSKLTEHKSVLSSYSQARLSSSNKSVLHKVDSNAPKSTHLKSQVQWPSSDRSNILVSENGTTHVSKSRVSTNASQIHLASSTNRLSNGSMKSGTVENTEADGMSSSWVASSSPSSINGLKSSVRRVVDQLRGPKCGKYTDKGLFSYDLFVKLYTSNKVELRPCGLINCGNSCYANAVLQCLAFTPPLTAYFVQGLHAKECVNKEWCFTCEFESLMLKAKEGKSSLSPIGILSQLQNIGSQLGNGREEDAHEFLRYAIDTMQSVCLKEAGVTASGSIEEDSTIIGLTFSGYLRSKIKCMKCHLKSERHERMMDLTVEIEGNIEKLEDALRKFTSTEILDGDNKYKCSRCKSYEKAKKKLTILEAPNILTIALKRFQSGRFGKLNKAIHFPEILDLAPYMSGTSDKSPIYRLYGVVVHLDVMNASFSGHYVCYVKNVMNKWFKIDDSTVTPVDLERVLTKGAYMLLYARCSPRAPRLIRNKIVSLDPKMKVSPLIMSSKNIASSSSSASACRMSTPAEAVDSVEALYLKFHRLQRILEEDSSDNCSFTSSNSDEGSCSTESTRDSMSTDDLSDFIFGSWNNSLRGTSDSDTCSSSSSSPLYTRQSPEASVSRAYYADSMTNKGSWGGRAADSEVKGDLFLHSDQSKQCRKLGNSNSCRDANTGKLGGNDPVKSGVPLRRSMTERRN